MTPPHEAATTAYDDDAAGEPTHVACLAMQFNTGVPTSEQKTKLHPLGRQATPKLLNLASLPHSP